MDKSHALLCKPEAATMANDENIRPSVPQTVPDQRHNDMTINRLRQLREDRFNQRNGVYFGRKFLTIDPSLPLPELQEHPGKAPMLLSVEHLQDFCNKSTAIYYTGTQGGFFEKMYKFILSKWAPHGNIHTLDIEFARFFAKLIRLSGAPPPTTENVIRIHQELCAASRLAREAGFAKKDPLSDLFFHGGQQVEFYKIKPLLDALIIVIDTKYEDTDFDKQEVRLIRTGITTGLSGPITFDSLTILETIDENEIVTTLPEAVRFVMDLDRREETLLEKRDQRVLDHYLGIPKVQFENKYFSRWMEKERVCWTGDVPVGPSTSWWKEILTDEDETPSDRSPRKKQKALD
jgi:hypothetical protein